MLVAVVVNPLRETALEDDWAYALTVRELLLTGRYRLHDWAAANMPGQAYWGALFSLAGGYSFASLRVSTLVLAAVAVVAFYYVAREHGFDRDRAALLALTLMANPLFVKFSFNFMTDLPFLGWSLVALLLYTRAIRTKRYPWMLLGAGAATAAILTRQFGVALPGALALLWLVAPDRRRRVPLFLAGVGPPVLAAAWQVAAGFLAPNWGAQYTLRQQHAYLGDGFAFGLGLLWRPTAILQYVALFCLPLIVVAAVTSMARVWRGLAGGGLPGRSRLAGVLALYVGGGIVVGHLVFHRPWLMPYLPWNFGALGDLGAPLRLALTVVTSAGAVLLGSVLVRRCANREAWRGAQAEHRLLDLWTLCYLPFVLTFFQIGDEYLLVFAPLALIALGRHLESALGRSRALLATICLLVVAGSSLWTRGSLARAEALWTGAEAVRARGVESRRIHSSWEWNCYFSAFDAYLAEAPSGDTSVSDFLHRWLPGRRRSAEYMVVTSLDVPPEGAWELLTEVAYHDVVFRVRRVYVLRKVTAKTT